MLGDRDSEMCVVFEDTVMIDGVMNGEPYLVGQFCHNLRCRLFRYVRLGNLLKYRKLPTLLQCRLLSFPLYPMTRPIAATVVIQQYCLETIG